MVNRSTCCLVAGGAVWCLLRVAGPACAAAPVANHHAAVGIVRPSDIGARTRSGYHATVMPGRPWYARYHSGRAIGPHRRSSHGRPYRHGYGRCGYPVTAWAYSGYSVSYSPYSYWPSWYAPVTAWPIEPFDLTAVNRFDPWAARPPVGGVDNRPATLAPDRPGNRGPRRSNAAARGRARRLIEQGDGRFAKGEYIQARQRYRTAATAAPDRAEASFRRGHALTAQGLYRRAAAAYRHGLQLDSDWTQSGFRWEQLYADDRATAQAHLNALVDQAAQHPHDPDLLLLLGIRLYFDGQVDRARPFFRRAQQLGGSQPGLDAFLTESLPAPPPAPATTGQEF